jgi:hypothetical protein
MSHQLISHSPDLKRLRDEGYELEVRNNYLLVRNVPYVNASKEVRFGILVSELTLAGDVTTMPGTHIAHFVGDHPHNADGTEIPQIKYQSQKTPLDVDLVADHSFSNKPSNGYTDFFEKMATYIAIISSPAEAIDPSVTARTFAVIEADETESVFQYVDTASSRAQINLITRKLERGKIAIIGLGGTGSYVLDLVAKTPVREIQLFDGDVFSQHNAFRAPGAPSIEELRERPSKVAYLKAKYEKMHRCIVANECYVDESNVDLLQAMDFVFLCIRAISLLPDLTG